MTKSDEIVSILLLAGSSRRMGEQPCPKPYSARLGSARLGQDPLFIGAARVLAAHGSIQPVIRAEDKALFAKAIKAIDEGEEAMSFLPPVEGGETRAASVLAGLKAVERLYPKVVLIHDGARPFIPAGVISTLRDKLNEGYDGVAPALPLTDNLKEVKGEVVSQFEQSNQNLMRTQTPQMFNYQKLIETFQFATLEERDELAVLEHLKGSKIKLIAGDERNIKITYPHDLERFALTKTGLGVDSHRFCAGDFILLGGVKIAHSFAIAAHSDGDVVLHALCDGIFGALAEKDLGAHFPSNDEWKDKDSSEMLNVALNMMKKKHFTLSHTDITVICEAPKVAPHREAIRNNLCSLTNLCSSQVSVKATTTDKLGLIGKGEGIAAMALVHLRAQNA